MDTSWLVAYGAEAALTDRFKGEDRRPHLLAAGLLGEAGSLAAEFKKITREGAAYPAYRQRVREELGDFLWYFVRLVEEYNTELLAKLPLNQESTPHERMELPTRLGSAVGRVLASLHSRSDHTAVELVALWDVLLAIAANAGVGLEDAARANIDKVRSRWPHDQVYRPLFDDESPPEEQLPRELTIDFMERDAGNRKVVLLRCNGIGVGDRITDNIEDPDGYRYHDIFHIAYAVFVGWSPVTRALLKCKRKSDPSTDENQDGARAAVVEEAVSAIVFNRAKQMRFFDGLLHVDYDLLKSIREFVEGFEVEDVPLWQWEVAILRSFAIFRELRGQGGGTVSWSLRRRELTCALLGTS